MDAVCKLGLETGSMDDREEWSNGTEEKIKEFRCQVFWRELDILGRSGGLPNFQFPLTPKAKYVIGVKFDCLT